MEKTGYSGPEAAQIAAHATRDRKQTLTPEEVLAAHKQMAAEFGNQPQQVIAAAREPGQSSKNVARSIAIRPGRPSHLHAKASSSARP